MGVVFLTRLTFILKSLPDVVPALSLLLLVLRTRGAVSRRGQT